MRTIDNVRLLKKILLHELDRLAETDKSDRSNEYKRDRLHGWIIDLTHIENFGSIGDHNSEISSWYKDESENSLYDFDIMQNEFKEYEEILRLATQFRV